MAGKAIVIPDPVSKDEIELVDKESKQYQFLILLNNKKRIITRLWQKFMKIIRNS